MHISVACGASRISQGGVDAFRNLRGLIRVAGGALHLRNFRRVRKVFDFCVTVRASQNSVYAGGMLSRMNGNVFPFLGFEIGLAVAGQAGLVLFQRLRGLFLPTRSRAQRKK